MSTDVARLPVKANVGQVPRELGDHLSDLVSVKNFNVTGNGSTNDTAKLLSAIDSGESLYFPPGMQCKIDEPLTISAAGQKLFAPGWGHSSIEVYGNNDALIFSPDDPETEILYDVGLHGLRVRRQGDATGGAGVRFIRCAGAVLSNYDIRYHTAGLDVEGCTELHVLTGQVSADLGWSDLHDGSFLTRFRHAIYGALRQAPSEIFIEDFNWKANAGNGNLEKALIIRGCDGLWFSNGHVGFANLDCIDIGLESATDNIISTFFSNVYADASFISDRAVRISNPAGVTPTTGKIWEVKFNGGTLGLAEEGGVLIDTAAARSISFDGTAIRSNKGFGVEVSAGRHISFNNCDISQNDRSTVGSTGGGVKIYGNAVDVSVHGGCVAGITATQRVGIEVSGAADRVSVEGVHFGDNTTDKSITTSGTIVRFSGCTTDKGESSSINYNERVSAVTGSVVHPAVIVGDDNTGLYSPGSDIVSIAAGGREVVRADLLDPAADTRLSVRSNIGGLQLLAGGAAGGDASILVSSQGVSPVYLAVRSGGLAVSVNDTGVAPTKQVQLRGGDASNNPKIGSSSGALGVSSPLSIDAGTASVPNLYVGDDNTGLFSPGSDVLSITAGGREVVRTDLLDPAADTRLSIRNNIAGVQVLAAGASSGSASLLLSSQGTSPIYLGVRSGAIAASVNDTGVAPTKQVQLRGGDASNNPKIGSSSGALGVSSPLSIDAGTASTPNLYIGDDNTGFFSPGSDILGATVGGREVLRADLLDPAADTRLSLKNNVAGLQLLAAGAAGGNASMLLSSQGTSPVYLAVRSGSVAAAVIDSGIAPTKQVQLRGGDASNNPKIGSSSGALEFSTPAAIPSYTVATAPSAVTYSRCCIYVTDESGGAVIAYSDGTNWRRVTDRAIIS